MDPKEVRRRIDSFPRWHYRFNLAGHETPIYDQKAVGRHRNRARYFYDPMVRHFGGSLRGKRVLDLGCNAGWWSLRASRDGADFVLGVDGRKMHVDQANLVFDAKGVERSRYEFACANLFDFDLAKFGEFDIVLCLGLLYHVSKPVELMERIRTSGASFVLVDTVVTPTPGSMFEVRRDSLEEPRDAVDYELVLVPSVRAVHDLAAQFGFGTVMLKPDFRDPSGRPDYRGALDYRDGTRRAFFWSKTEIPNASLSVETEPLPDAPKTFPREAWRDETFEAKPGGQPQVGK